MISFRLLSSSFYGIAVLVFGADPGDELDFDSIAYDFLADKNFALQDEFFQLPRLMVSDHRVAAPPEINGWTAEERQFLEESFNEEHFPASQDAAQVEDEFEADLIQTYQSIVSRALARRNADRSSLSSEEFQALISDVVAARGLCSWSLGEKFQLFCKAVSALGYSPCMQYGTFLDYAKMAQELFQKRVKFEWGKPNIQPAVLELLDTIFKNNPNFSDRQVMAELRGGVGMMEEEEKTEEIRNYLEYRRWALVDESFAQACMEETATPGESSGKSRQHNDSISKCSELGREAGMIMKEVMQKNAKVSPKLTRVELVNKSVRDIPSETAISEWIDHWRKNSRKNSSLFDRQTSELMELILHDTPDIDAIGARVQLVLRGLDTIPSEEVIAHWIDNRRGGNGNTKRKLCSSDGEQVKKSIKGKKERKLELIIPELQRIAETTRAISDQLSSSDDEDQIPRKHVLTGPRHRKIIKDACNEFLDLGIRRAYKLAIEKFKKNGVELISQSSFYRRYKEICKKKAV